MATWREMSLESRRSAQVLLTEGYFRSCISRSYYAAYCAVTSELSGRITFGFGGNNPSHTDLPNLILHNLISLSIRERQEIRKAVAHLWKARVDADYAPAAHVDRSIALTAFRNAARILFLLGIKDE